MTKLFGVGGAICEAPEFCHCGEPATVLIPIRTPDHRNNRIDGLCEKHAARRRTVAEWEAAHPEAASEINALEIQAAEWESEPKFYGCLDAVKRNLVRAAAIKSEHEYPVE